MWTVSMLEKAASIILTSVGLNTRPYLLVIAVLHVDIGLGEEAENLGEQVALMLGNLLRPIAAILAQAALPRASSGSAAGVSTYS